MKYIGLILVAVLVVVWFGRNYSERHPVTGEVMPTVAAHVPSAKQNPDDSPPPPQTVLLGKAEALETNYDFGSMAYGQKGAHTFIIKNEGQGPLKVKSAGSSCSCTLGGVKNGNNVLPGETVEVELTWTVKQKSEKFRHWAEVSTNDPENHLMRFDVVGRVVEMYHMIPGGEWDLGELQTNEPTVFEGVIYSLAMDKFDVVRSECQNPLVSVSWEPISLESVKAENAKSAQKVLVTVAPGSPTGNLRELISLKTSDKMGGFLASFIIAGRLKGPIVFQDIELRGVGWNPQTNTINLGNFLARDGKKIKVYFYVRDVEGEFEVQAIEQKFDSLQFTFNPVGRVVGKSKVYDVDIEIPPGSSATRIEDNMERVKLNLKNPGGKEFLFKVSYRSI